MADATVTERQTKRVDELVRGDWIKVDFDEFVDRAKVLHVETYQPDEHLTRACVLYRGVGEASVASARLAIDDPIGMLTDAEIDEAMTDERRDQLAHGLDRLARFLQRPKTPVPPAWHGLTVEIDLGDVAAVEKIAKILGVTVHDAGPFVTVSQIHDTDQGAGVRVHWRASKPQGAPASTVGRYAVAETPNDEIPF